MHKYYNKKGFTIIEMLITITIVVVISMIASFTYKGNIDAANNSLAGSDLKALSLLIENYYLENGSYPNNLDEINNANFLDPWGKPYSYLNLTSGNQIGNARKDRNLVPINSNYDLYSDGKDGDSRPPLASPVSHDDIIYASDGEYIGIASSF